MHKLKRKYTFIEKVNIALFKQYIDVKNLVVDIDENKMKELGFYFTVLSKRHFIDIETVGDSIIDGDFLNVVFGEHNTDLGIDAYYIDHDNKIISIYNFKYKTKYVGGEIQPTTLGDVTGFLQAMDSLVKKRKKQLLSDRYDLKDYTKKTKEALKTIIDILYDVKLKYKLELVLVSNVDKKMNIKNDISKAMKSLGVNKISQLVIDDISLQIVVKPNLKCKITIEDHGYFIYEEDKSKKETYVFPMKLFDLIRITNIDDESKLDTNIEFKDQIPVFDQLVIDENVRGFISLKRSSYNTEIVKTLKESPSLFFLYNNGVTIIADEIKKEDANYTNNDLELTNYQIVNGGQTIRSLYEFIQSNKNWEDHLKNAKVLVKIIQLDNKTVKPAKIAEYTNSQNPISSIDIKTIDSLQIKLEQYLSENNIGYIRKLGDYNFDYSSHKQNISMIKLGQILFSKIGNPHNASNTRSKIFNTDYDKIFNTETIYEDSLNIINEYFEIKEYFSKSNSVFTEQRLFYIVYLINNTRRGIESSVKLLEKALKNFDNDGVPISHARKLIKVSFKVYLDRLAKIKN